MHNSVISRSLTRKWHLPIWFYPAVVILASAFTALAATLFDRPLFLILAAVGLLIALSVLLKPELGLLILLFITYTRVFEVLNPNEGSLSLYTAYLGFLAGVVVLRWFFWGEGVNGWHMPALFLGLFGFMILASFLYAEDESVVATNFIYFIKDALMVLLIVVLLRRATTLRTAVWVLLAAGIFLGSITVFQQATGTFDNNYWGFGQVKVANIVEDVQGNRIEGPGLDPNTYGQYMLILVPLAWDRIWSEKKKLLRLLAGWAFVVSALSIVFTFSRGIFIGLALVILLLLIQKRPRPGVVLITLVLGALMIPLIPPQYTDRLRTLTYIVPGVGNAEQQGLSDVREATQDVSFRGRLSENIVGWRMSLDHPILGVGYGNFKTHYQSYSRPLGLDSRREGRSAHNLYLEIFAELGIVGLAWLFALQWVVFRGLMRAKDIFHRLGLNKVSGIPAALLVSLAGFLFTSIFLHMVYPRYFWLFYAVLLAVPSVAERELDLSFLRSYVPQVRKPIAGEKNA